MAQNEIDITAEGRLTKKGVELLLKVKETVLRNPSSLEMRTWLEQVDVCHTVGCIAGWTVLHSGATPKSFGFGSIQDRAIELLGFRRKRYREKDLDGVYVTHVTDCLFFMEQWPDVFYYEYQAAKTQQERAVAVGKVIDDFIAKYYQRWEVTPVGEGAR